MIKRIIFSILCLFFSQIHLTAQNKFTISGTIADESTGESIIGARISIKEITNVGAVTNSYGYYSLTLPQGEYTVLIKFISYNSKEEKISLNANLKKDFKLSLNSKQMKEIVVKGKKENEQIVNAEVGVTKLDIKEIKKIPVLLGEQDIIKTLTLTPGVKSLGEGNGGFYVRGGDNSQNLILIDEATVYNANHLLGFFSTFNSDAIKDVRLFKGTAPAEYGGRLSSVLDVKMNEGNNKRYRIGGGIGLISSRLYVEGPIVKDKGSFLITGRRTYADLFLKLSSNEQMKNNELYFYDINAKANYRIDDKNKIYFSAYLGRDVMKMSNRFGIDWGNTTATLRWNHLWSQKLFSNTSLIYSDYDYRVNINREADEFSLTSSIQNINLKHEFQYFLNNKHSLNFGFNSFYHTIVPGQVEVSENSSINPVQLQNRYALENAVFFSGNWKPSNKWNIEYGLRLSSFNLMGAGDFYSYNSTGDVIDTTTYGSGQIVKTYVYPEPRLNIAYIVDENNSVKLSYTRNTQNLHLLKNSTSTTPTDIWIASSDNVQPEISDQFSMGYFKNFDDNKFQFSAETYYRVMQNQMDLKDGAEIRANDKIEGEILFGEGRAYGLELFLKKKTGKLTGWIGYTLSKTERRINGINDGNWYPARQDATHDLSIVGIYDISDKWSVSATWVYNTGSAVTFPSGKYAVNGSTSFYYTERNGYRMPDYHRLDIGATRFFAKTKNRESSLNLSLYNAYGQKNAYTIDFQDDPNDPTKTQAVKTYLFTYIPSITYNFKF